MSEFIWRQISPTTYEVHANGLLLGVINNANGHVSVVPLIGGRVASTCGATSFEHGKERMVEFWAQTRETVKRAFPEGV